MTQFRDSRGNVVTPVPLYDQEGDSRRWRWLWMIIPHRHDHVHPGRYRMWRCSRCWRAMHCAGWTDPPVWSPFARQRLRAYKPWS